MRGERKKKKKKRGNFYTRQPASKTSDHVCELLPVVMRFTLRVCDDCLRVLVQRVSGVPSAVDFAID